MKLRETGDAKRGASEEETQAAALKGNICFRTKFVRNELRLVKVWFDGSGSGGIRKAKGSGSKLVQLDEGKPARKNTEMNSMVWLQL